MRISIKEVCTVDTESEWNSEDKPIPNLYPLCRFSLGWNMPKLSTVHTFFLYVLGWLTGALFSMYCTTYPFHVRGLILGLVKVSPHHSSSTSSPTKMHKLLFKLWKSGSLEDEVWFSRGSRRPSRT